MTRAWSTIRKQANEAGFFARRADCEGQTCYILLDSDLRVNLCTFDGEEIQNAVYALEVLV